MDWWLDILPCESMPVAVSCRGTRHQRMDFHQMVVVLSGNVYNVLHALDQFCQFCHAFERPECFCLEVYAMVCIPGPTKSYKIRLCQSTGISTAGSQFRRSGRDVILPASVPVMVSSSHGMLQVIDQIVDEHNRRQSSLFGEVLSTSHCSIRGCAHLPFQVDVLCTIRHRNTDVNHFSALDSQPFWYCDQHLPASSLLFKSGSIRSGPAFQRVLADCTTSHHLSSMFLKGLLEPQVSETAGALAKP